MHEVGLVIAQEHDLVHVHQAPCQRERADVARDDRLVVNLLGDEAHALNAHARAAVARVGHLEQVDVAVLVDDGPDNRGDLVVAVADVAAEHLGFHGQVHERKHGRHVGVVVHVLHGLRLKLRGIDELLRGDPKLFGRGEREHRQRLLHRSVDLVFHPLLHVHC